MKKFFRTIFIFGIITLFFSVAVMTFADNVTDSLNALLGSPSTDQGTPKSATPKQDTVKPYFEKIVVGDANNGILLGDNEISGIVTTRQVAFGVQTSGDLGSFIGLNSDTGMVIENSVYLGLMGVSTAMLNGVGIKVSDADDIGIYANGKSIGFYSQGTIDGLNMTTMGYGGVLGSSGEGTGVIGIGGTGKGVSLSDGSYLGGSGIGIFSNANANAFIGENYATFTIKNDATLAALNTADLYVSETASFGIFDAESAKAKNNYITLIGSLEMENNDLSVAKGVTITGPTSGSNFVGGNLIFSDYISDIKIGPDKDGHFGIADDVSIDGDMYVEKDLKGNEMGNITIHDQTATGTNANANVSCDSQQTIMGCGASIDGGSADITEVYPSGDFCYAKSLGSGSTLHVYAYCFEPDGDGTGSETPPPVNNPCDNPNDCGVIDINFNTGNDWLWNWEVACNPPCKPSDTSFKDVTADCGGTERQGCPGSNQNGGDITDNILTESGSYLQGWAGLNEYGNAFGNMTTAGLAYMLQTGKLSNSQIADMDTNQVDAAMELLGNNNYGVDGQLQSGAYAGLEDLVNSIANIRTTGNVNIPGNIQP